MQKKRKKLLRLSSAITLIGTGILGLLFPLLPGIPLLLVGLYLLNPKKFKHATHKLLAKLKKR